MEQVVVEKVKQTLKRIRLKVKAYLWMNTAVWSLWIYRDCFNAWYLVDKIGPLRKPTISSGLTMPPDDHIFNQC